MKEQHFKEAIKIRATEEAFLKLFSEGKSNGTVHTCIGQEFSAIAVCKYLTDEDTIVSNHRCHGHFLAFTGDYTGLVAEIMGKSNGVCAGIGSSQHLYKKNFLSNGVQGGMVPVAAGISLAKKRIEGNDVVAAFIGDGTFGEGVIYETLNIASLWELPLLIVCENNFYSQSTPQKANLAGSIINRVKSFDIDTFEANTWNLEELFNTAKEAVDHVRNSRKPGFLLINTYRLKAHSKGDDYRDKTEINSFNESDPITLLSKSNPESFNKYKIKTKEDIELIINSLNDVNGFDKELYYEISKQTNKLTWEKIDFTNERVSDRIYKFFKDSMSENETIYFIGEDINYPYGGDCNVTRDLSKLYRDRVYSTPISEAAITGIGNGLSLSGQRAFVEIMFGDFVTLAFDQIVNHASKFYHMYNKQIKCPVVIRTPMGGGKGYGPTHSQSLEKFLQGIDNITLVALNTLIDPYEIYSQIVKYFEHPVIVIENKLDYARKNTLPDIENYDILKSNEVFPTVKISPKKYKPNLTIVTYGGSVNFIKPVLDELFYEHEIVAEVFVLSKLSPLENLSVRESVSVTGNLVTIEEGKVEGGIGSEVVASLSANESIIDKSLRIGAKLVPIPSASYLEAEVLPNVNSIIHDIMRVF